MAVTLAGGRSCLKCGKPSLMSVHRRCLKSLRLGPTSARVAGGVGFRHPYGPSRKSWSVRGSFSNATRSDTAPAISAAVRDELSLPGFAVAPNNGACGTH